MRIRRLVALEPDGEKTTLAVFKLEGQELTVEWRDGSELIRPSIESWGVATADGNIPMTDGPKFFEALTTAFAQSTYVDIVDGAEP